MAVSLTHSFQSAVTDSADASLVQPSHWNAQHQLTCATSVILGRVTASTGAVEELTPTQAKGLLAVAVADVSGLQTALDAKANDSGIEERARDAIGAAVIDSSTIDATYNDAGDTITLDIIRSALKPTETILIAVGDETTAITTGTAKVTFRMPYAFTVTEVRASLTTVSSSGIPTIDINESGTTILSTKLTIDASEKTSTTAATAAVISDASLADDAEMTIDIDVAGTGAAGLKVYIIGYRT